VSTGGRRGWSALVDPPGEAGSAGAEMSIFTGPSEAFTTGLWEREPDTWPFERAYDEVAMILEGEADIETEDGQMLSVRAGDVLVTPKGSKGVWHVRSKIVKFYAIHDSAIQG
jgi:Predicted enzyme of the cupin superfamily